MTSPTRSPMLARPMPTCGGRLTMTEPQQEPVSWHYVWLRVLTQAHQQGRSVEQSIADADAAVAAYRQRLTARGEEVTHD
jgi:hypothetical protein